MNAPNLLFLALAGPACAWCCGFGIFRTVLFLAIVERYLPNSDLPGSLSILGRMPWFVLICVLGGFEMIIDLIPRIDLKWHRLTAHLRIIAAIVLTWMILQGQDMMTHITMSIAALILASFAWCIHTAPRRAAIPIGTSNFITPLASLTEDCVIGTIVLPLSAMPALTILMLVFTILAGMLIMYIIWDSVKEEMAFLFSGKRAVVIEPTEQHSD